jgi:hypothetical protein
MSTTADQLPTNEVDYVKVVRMQNQVSIHTFIMLCYILHFICYI